MTSDSSNTYRFTNNSNRANNNSASARTTDVPPSATRNKQENMLPAGPWSGMEYMSISVISVRDDGRLTGQG